ncbi:hypothetical protein [Burkholderia sp. F1]|uniref:hypothetical protein n=1 Tax=Burkholderia sp. F1 TaxID=3366817 RepID=UPI003D71EDC7
MIISTPSQPRRMPLLRLATAAWLLALSSGLVIVMQDVHKLSAPPAPSPLAGQIDALTARVGQAEQQLAAIKRQPAPLAPEALTAARTERETRLTQVEASLAARADAQALEALQTRVEKLEASPARAPMAAATGRPTPTPAKPVKVLPPFQVLGVELRGGQRFLTVAPLDATNLNQSRLLRVGESDGGWTLESIDATQASFRVSGKTRHLVLP